MPRTRPTYPPEVGNGACIRLSCSPAQVLVGDARRLVRLVCADSASASGVRPCALLPHCSRSSVLSAGILHSAPGGCGAGYRSAGG